MRFEKVVESDGKDTYSNDISGGKVLVGVDTITTPFPSRTFLDFTIIVLQMFP